MYFMESKAAFFFFHGSNAESFVWTRKIPTSLLQIRPSVFLVTVKRVFFVKKGMPGKQVAVNFHQLYP